MKKIVQFLFIFLVVTLIILLYSRYIATSNLKTKEYLINDNISENFDGLKIVHFSDFHYLRDGNYKKIKKLVKEINIINPDIIIFTGDLIDNDYEFNNEDIEKITNVFNSIKAKYGKYSVIGNHDKKNIDIVKEIYLNSHFKLLDNNYDIINANNSSIFIGGVNTFTDNKADIDKVMVEFNKEKKEDIYKIILTHEPDYTDTILEKYDINLILAGNSHNGQINIPLIKKSLLPKGSQKYYENHYKINNTNLYISSGIGEEEFNLRLFNKPSINFYRINKITDK